MDQQRERRIENRVLRHGRVVDSNGQPVAGALVAVAWGTGPTPEIAIRTDETGAFRIGLPPGRYRLQAVTESSGSGQTETEGGEGGEIVIKVD